MNTPIDMQKFVESIANIHEKFDRKGVDFTVIGSVGLVASGLYHFSQEDFHRNAPEKVNQIPDLDILVQRKDLPAAREVRDSTKNIKLGLALPSMQIDLHPEKDHSYLTVGNKKYAAVKSSVFEPQAAKLSGVNISVLPDETQRHIYSSLQLYGRTEDKKLASIEVVIGRDRQLHEADDPYLQFHQYQAMIKDHEPGLSRMIKHYSRIIDRLPDNMKEPTHKLGVLAAGKLGLR